MMLQNVSSLCFAHNSPFKTPLPFKMYKLLLIVALTAGWAAMASGATVNTCTGAVAGHFYSNKLATIPATPVTDHFDYFTCIRTQQNTWLFYTFVCPGRVANVPATSLFDETTQKCKPPPSSTCPPNQPTC